MITDSRCYSQVTFRVTVSSVVMLFVNLTLQVTLVPWCSAEELNIKVELCLCVTAVRFSVLKAVMFPVMWESFCPGPLHSQVISGSDPEQRPGAVQVSVVCCPSVSGGIITVGFWIRSNERAVHEWNQVSRWWSFTNIWAKTIRYFVEHFNGQQHYLCSIKTANITNMLVQWKSSLYIFVVALHTCNRDSCSWRECKSLCPLIPGDTSNSELIWSRVWLSEVTDDDAAVLLTHVRLQ